MEQLGALCDSFDSVLMKLKKNELKSMCAAAGLGDGGTKLELVLRLRGSEVHATTPEDELWRTAVHEAGHILLYELYDIGYSEASLSPECADVAGSVTASIGSNVLSNMSTAAELREFAQRVVMAAVGGLAAERIVCHTDNAGILAGAHSDTAQASQILGALTIPSENPERERRAWLQWLLARTASVIRLNLDPLEAVARELLRCGKLSRAQVQDVLAGHQLQDGDLTQESIRSLGAGRYEDSPEKPL
ncbi:hypothetical protein KEG38_20550 [Polyangium jinanense]|uniref:SAP domain-containing protein n=1 Tax=Polyangium jinanense TaxID=2829994 RepID=UPI00233FF1F9|nr:SAP domain-containing protein [Polyangium jinanense]MDC3956263.1 hypothetical protein [Polyangium jinanense]